MTVSTDGAALDVTPPRPADLALARAHLRLGSLALARAELETLAGSGELDEPGRVDLAEARWRTGDLAGAGEAALDALSALGDESVALVIAAEAAAALGRPNEARRLAVRAMDCARGPIDAVFAGMPRSAVWPADAAEPPPTEATLFHQEPIAAQARRAGDSDTLATSTLRATFNEPPAAGPASRGPLAPGFWDVDSDVEPAGADLPDPAEELEAAARALVAGSFDEAVVRFSLTLRLAPSLAPAVLEATGGPLGAGGATGPARPGLGIVRGDAYRLVGLETEARRAYAMAAWSGSRDRRRAAAASDASAVEPEIPGASDTIRPVPRARSRAPRTRNPR